MPKVTNNAVPISKPILKRSENIVHAYLGFTEKTEFFSVAFQSVKRNVINMTLIGCFYDWRRMAEAVMTFYHDVL